MHYTDQEGRTWCPLTWLERGLKLTYKFFCRWSDRHSLHLAGAFTVHKITHAVLFPKGEGTVHEGRPDPRGHNHLLGEDGICPFTCAQLKPHLHEAVKRFMESTEPSCAYEARANVRLAFRIVLPERLHMEIDETVVSREDWSNLGWPLGNECPCVIVYEGNGIERWFSSVGYAYPAADDIERMRVMLAGLGLWTEPLYSWCSGVYALEKKHITYEDWSKAVHMYAEYRKFEAELPTYESNMRECFDAGMLADEAVEGFIQDACERAALHARAPLE